MDNPVVRVLLVEDNPGDARLVGESLREVASTRFEVESFVTLAEGRERVLQGGVDVALLDLSLPDSRGLDTVLAFLKIAPRTPVIVLTGGRDSELALAAVKAGAQDYVVKGTYDGALLARAIHYAIERSRFNEERIANAARIKEIARLKELDEVKTRFINHAAHELSTPLTPLKLQLHLLLNANGASTFSDEQHRALSIVNRNFERLSRLVLDILDASRVQADWLKIHAVPLELRGVLLDAIESFEGLAQENQITLVAEADAPVRIDGDGNRIMQVLYNFLANAMRFTKPGGRVIARLEEDADTVTVSVIDSGIGLSEAQRDQLFEPFVQVHGEGSTVHGGSGLGLYISRGIIEAHGGRVGVESAGPGQGSTFSFTLPRRLPGDGT